MKLADIYATCVQAGIEADPRDRLEIDRVLSATRVAYDKLDEDDREFFDLEKLTNPYADTRTAPFICNGDGHVERPGHDRAERSEGWKEG